MGEVVAAVVVGTLVGATLGHPRARGIVTVALGVPVVIFAGLALVGKADVGPVWEKVVSQTERFLATDAWLPASIGLVVGLCLFAEATGPLASGLWRNGQRPFRGVLEHLKMRERTQ